MSIIETPKPPESVGKPMLRIAFLASNNGTSFRAIAEEARRGDLAVIACLLVSNKSTSAALKYAEDLSIRAVCIPTQADEAAADEALLRELRDARIELVILSGYLRKLGLRTITAFEGRILNVHPALLPGFSGKGMYGRRVHQAVFDAGETVTGATVHLVDGEYDHGRIIATQTVAINPSDTVETIEQDVMQAECSLFIEVVRCIAGGLLRLPL